MRFLEKVKDGGTDSNVDAYVLIEIKSAFSIMLLKFNKGCRQAFHTHAFDAFTMMLSGDMIEEFPDMKGRPYKRGKWKYTPKGLLHRVRAFKDSWAFTVRGPWDDTWTELERNIETTFTHGRKVLSRS